ncbi:VanW family protein [Occultella gossypii]|uniref:VanW family protein n=1 Tax=Occultella gossypii TaxID=2800820 RepID=A0ABS7S9U8_9MICO|nr:VanW family protein [Occultella gossypii]MBZ2196525.1 VanW family protein [Occultella gossypii]
MRREHETPDTAAGTHGPDGPEEAPPGGTPAEPSDAEATQVIAEQVPEPAVPAEPSVPDEPPVPDEPSDAEATQVIADPVAEPAAPAEPAVAAEPAPDFDDVVAGDSAGGPDEPAGDESAVAAGGKGRKPKGKRKRRARKVLIWAAAVIVVLAGAYVASAWFLGDRVPGDTRVAGVDISGLPVDEAVRTLDEGLAEARTVPVPVHFGDVSGELDPTTAGLDVDTEATVARITGFTLDPRVVLGHVFGLGDQPAVSAIDEAALDGAVEALAGSLDVPPTEGVIEFVDGAPVVTEPADGTSLDVEGASELLADEWLTGQRPLELPSDAVSPMVDSDVIATAMSEQVEPMLSGPVTVALNDTTAELAPAEIASAATMAMDDASGSLVLALDGAVLADLVTAKVPSIGEAPQDAQIVLGDNGPTIVPAVTGTGLDPAALAEGVRAAAVNTDPAARTATLELTQTEAEFSTADAEALGVTEVIGTFATPYPYDPTRTENLVAGTAHINGTLVLPGEQFSLLDALRPITAANGYTVSGVVVNGFEGEAIGGGLSQVSTTSFNAGFEAGLTDVTHQPHSRWFSRYPEGREATVYDPSIDMVWENNTGYGVLIQAYVTDSEVVVTLWGTDVFDVSIVTGGRYAFTSPQTVYNTSANCIPERGGSNGFSVDVTRTVTRDGEVVTDDTYSHRYSAWNRVVCGPAPSGDDADDG